MRQHTQATSFAGMGYDVACPRRDSFVQPCFRVNFSVMASVARPAPTLVSLPAVLAVLLFAVGLADAGTMIDGDSYWHVAAGRWIAEHAAVPTKDVWSHSVPGIPWTAHEWLSELLMFRIWQSGGWFSVQVLASAAYALTAAVMLRFLIRRVSAPVALAATLLCVEMMRSHFVIRPHVLVWPLTAVWVSALVDAVENRRTPSLWLLPLLVLWANMHASFTMGIGLAGALALDALLSERDRAARVAVAKGWAVFGVACVLCTLLNPRGVNAISHAAGVMSMSATLDIVREWLSPDFHHFNITLVWLGLLFTAALSGRLRLSPVRIAMLLGLVYLTLKHQRYQATLGLVSPFLVALPLAGVFASPTSTNGAAERRDAGWEAWARRPAKVIGLMLCLALAVATAQLIHLRRFDDTNPAVTPTRAVDAFDATGVTGRVFNDYVLGGYLIHRGIPVFIDGRGDMYGDAFMLEWSRAINLTRPRSLENVFAKYDIGWTLLPPHAPAVELLDHLGAWERIYGDSVAVVHVRRDLLRAARDSGSAASR